MPSKQRAELSPGEMLGPYRITREIGRGGMSIIYEASNDSICKRVAVKVLLPDLAEQEEMVQRFLNEARSVNLIGHSGLVFIFEFGRDDRGIVYIVMELLDGVTLAHLLMSRGKMSLGMALCIVQQIASAVNAAHQRQIVHRDLKPANIFLCRDRAVHGELRAKVLDFGVAKVSTHPDLGGADGMLTRTGTFLGTPYYVAPEQIRDASQVTDRADVYSLGVILYQTVTGKLPFSGDGTAVLLRHVEDTAPRLREQEAGVPKVLDELCAAMLEKNPSVRPSMSDVEAVLSLVLSDISDSTVRRSAEALYASSLWTSESARSSIRSIRLGAPRPPRRKRWYVAAFLLFAGGGAALSLQLHTLSSRVAAAVHQDPSLHQDPPLHQDPSLHEPPSLGTAPPPTPHAVPLDLGMVAESTAAGSSNTATALSSTAASEVVPTEGRGSGEKRVSAAVQHLPVRARARVREEPRRASPQPPPSDEKRAPADFTDDDIRLHN